MHSSSKPNISYQPTISQPVIALVHVLVLKGRRVPSVTLERGVPVLGAAQSVVPGGSNYQGLVRVPGHIPHDTVVTLILLAPEDDVSAQHIPDEELSG